MVEAWRYDDAPLLVRDWEIKGFPHDINPIQTNDGYTPEELAWDNWGLDEASIVFEVGGHNGTFTEEMIKRYRPIIYFFEPSPRAFAFSCEKFKDYPRITMFPFGLGDRTGDFTFGDESRHGGSFLSNNDPVVTARMVDIVEFFVEYGITHVDFMQINVEGAEHFLLPHMIDYGILDMVQRLMLHWHTPPQLALHQSIIINKILETHDLTRLWTFQCWEKRRDE